METKQERMSISPRDIGRTMLRDIVRHPIRNLLFTAGVLGLASFGMHGAHKEQVRERYESGLTHKVDIAVDRHGNNDGHTLDDEWANAYDFVGLKYNSHNPVALTTAQKERYLATHPMEDSK